MNDAAWHHESVWTAKGKEMPLLLRMGEGEELPLQIATEISTLQKFPRHSESSTSKAKRRIASYWITQDLLHTGVGAGHFHSDWRASSCLRSWGYWMLHRAAKDSGCFVKVSQAPDWSICSSTSKCLGNLPEAARILEKEKRCSFPLSSGEARKRVIRGPLTRANSAGGRKVSQFYFSNQKKGSRDSPRPTKDHLLLVTRPVHWQILGLKGSSRKSRKDLVAVVAQKETSYDACIKWHFVKATDPCSRYF